MGTSLVVGATGALGSVITELLAASGVETRALVRSEANQARRRRFAEVGVEQVVGDLKEPATLESACQGVDVVLSTATATMSRRAGDDISSVDDQGQRRLVEIAERAGVRRFVYVSFPPLGVDFALQRAKRAVEHRLRASRMEVVILQPTHFMEVWLSPALGFDPVKGSAVVFGTGTNPVSWISIRDVARFAVAAMDLPGFAGKVVPLGGPEALSTLQVLTIFEDLSGVSVQPNHLPESVFEQQLDAGLEPLAEAQAAMGLVTARGLVADSTPAVELLPGRLISVRDFAAQVLAAVTEQGESR